MTELLEIESRKSSARQPLKEMSEKSSWGDTSSYKSPIIKYNNINGLRNSINVSVSKF